MGKSTETSRVYVKEISVINEIKNIITNAFQTIENYPIEIREVEIKKFLKDLLGYKNSNQITESEFAYFVTSLAQFEENLKSSKILSEILGDAGILELPATQVEKKGYDREKLKLKLLREIGEYITTENVETRI